MIQQICLNKNGIALHFHNASPLIYYSLTLCKFSLSLLCYLITSPFIYSRTHTVVTDINVNNQGKKTLLVQLFNNQMHVCIQYICFKMNIKEERNFMFFCVGQERGWVHLLPHYKAPQCRQIHGPNQWLVPAVCVRAGVNW